jgi:hypothetical protein
MLVVLMVLLMTTATATFAIHSTSIEIRAAGHSRQALQAEYLAEGGAYAALSYVDVLKANGSLAQYFRTDVASGVAIGAGEMAMDQSTNLLRVDMDDFTTGAGVNAPPVETEAARTPSFGPYSAYAPSFRADGTDLYQISRAIAGRDLSGRGSQFYRMTLTSRGSMNVPSELAATAVGQRAYHETVMRARALTEVGPFWIGGH